MNALRIEQLISLRSFPAVVHPRHARELLAAHDDRALSDWVEQYAVTSPEHRRLLEDILSSLAWRESGMAATVHGLYGSGKSHLLVLLHLLAALPDAWTPFLASHPEFRRYADAMQRHHRLVVHFSLDEYRPRDPLERTLNREIARTVQNAGITVPAEWHDALSRVDAWGAMLDACRAVGYDGMLLLVDELSMFLAAKTPAQREGDAAYLQFLADLTGRTPLWLIGVLQRNLGNVGALRTHSWRQVEDRFRRYALSVQEIGGIIRDKLIVRSDPAAIRTVVSTELAPAADSLKIGISASDMQQHWPFHPAALDLLAAVTSNYLSPHRSLVDILQQIERTDYFARTATHLITPLDLFSLVQQDLQNDDILQPLWNAVTLLRQCADSAPDVKLAHRCVDLLTLLHLADHTATVAQLRTLLFDGDAAPMLDSISDVLHHLRRRGAYLSVQRDSNPDAETFSLAVKDEAGALAVARMQEFEQSLTADDPRLIEIAISACDDPAWPLAATLHGVTINVPWCDSERTVCVSFALTASTNDHIRHYEGLSAGQADGHVLLCWHAAASQKTAVLFDGPYAATLLRWHPRDLTSTELALWKEYAAWQLATDASSSSATPHERRVLKRCREYAEEIRTTVTASVRALVTEGRWLNARGESGKPVLATTLAETLAGMFSRGFDELFPLFTTISATGVPSRAACQQLLTHFIVPGEATLPPQSLLAEYIERFAVPLGCVEFSGTTARLVPPRREILEAMLNHLCDGPLRVPEAIALLRRPPFGLTTEQGKLAIFAAVRSGALHGLDAFLQPIDTLALNDALVFVGLPAIADDCHRELVAALVTHWELPLEPWPLACSQLERRLRQWREAYTQDLPQIRTALDDWSAALQLLPWTWQTSEALINRMTQLASMATPSFDELLAGLGQTQFIQQMEILWQAAQWWLTHGRRISALQQLSLPVTLLPERDTLIAQLSEGERSFTQLTEIEARLDMLFTTFRDAYRTWHDSVFGDEVIAALRLAFDHPDFRAIKLLSRLPLPVPETAEQCLQALAQARTAYCPGQFDQLDSIGCCVRCRLPFGSASPMPNAGEIMQYAVSGLREYEALFSTHPWVEETRRQLPRAPEDIATKVKTLFDWQEINGSPPLIALLDEHTIAWLCRNRRIAGTRRTSQLQHQISGRDLTVGEARALMHDWLDPEGVFGDDALLSFE